MRRILIAVLLVLAPIASARAQVRLEVPQETEAPFYARLLRTPYFGFFEEIYHDDEWAAIAFYRDTSCVPADFNLLEGADFTGDPIYGLRPFGCPLRVSGFEIWENGPGTLDNAPVHTRLRGNGAVEIWFVSWPALSAAVQDGQLTIADLNAMPSLRRATADRYSETLHPGEQANVNHISIQASGTTEDGARFVFHAAVSGTHLYCCSSDGPQQQVIIRFW